MLQQVINYDLKERDWQKDQQGGKNNTKVFPKSHMKTQFCSSLKNKYIRVYNGITLKQNIDDYQIIPEVKK